MLCFVLIKDGTGTFILICSDLNMSPEELVELYAWRFNIEVTFKIVKHIICGLYYHFWTTAWPENMAKALAVADLEHMSDRSKKLISGALNAIKGFVNMALIATELLQILAQRHVERIFQLHDWWMRTRLMDFPSEEMVKTVIQYEFYHDFRKFKHTAIFRIILNKCNKNKMGSLKN